MFTIMPLPTDSDLPKRALLEITNQPSQSQSDESQKTVTSSMETVPTDVIDGFSEPEDGLETGWGRLFSISPFFESMALEKDEYTFGRGDDCDCQFKANKKHLSVFQTYSKVHFVLKREKKSTGTYTFLIDKSSNGTYVNGQVVGKGNMQALNNNDVIALSLENNKAFMYHDATDDFYKTLPSDLREKYVLSSILGQGSYGQVRLAFLKGTSDRFAVKIMAKNMLTARGRDNMDISQLIQREIQILKAVRHPCIVEVVDVYDTPDKLYAVLELVEGGELFDRIVSLNSIPENDCKCLFYQMVQAIKYLHDQNIAHRDIKPENILLSSKDSLETLVKVTDFGVSKFMDSQTKMKTICGTMDYVAPEVLLGSGTGSYTNAVDIWSLGVVLFVCLGGYSPFNEKESMSKEAQITGGHYSFPAAYWKNVSADGISLIKGMMTVDPEKRLKIGEVLKHPWLQDKEIIEKAETLMKASYNTSNEAEPKPKKRKVDAEAESSK